MDILKNMLLPPGVEHLQMLPVLVVFMLWAHLPFAGIAWICNLLSLVFWRRDPAAARDLGRVAPITWSTIGIFVVLPLASLLFLFQHYLYGETVPVGSYILRLAFPICGMPWYRFGVARPSSPPVRCCWQAVTFSSPAS